MTTCPNHLGRPSVLESAYGFCHECRTALRSASGRRYELGEFIPGHGHVVSVSLTAYRVHTGAWVSFYGPNGVDGQRTAEGLVTFADGSRYGGAR